MKYHEQREKRPHNGLERRVQQAKFGWNFGEIWTTQANKTQLKVEQDPTDGVLYKIGESWE